MSRMPLILIRPINERINNLLKRLINRFQHLLGIHSIGNILKMKVFGFSQSEVEQLLIQNLKKKLTTITGNVPMRTDNA